MDRFERQYILPGFGQAAQKKLCEAKVLVVGAGGLGCPSLLYLAAAGIGTIGIVDGDKVSLSNLNRQVLFGQRDIGKNKAETASKIILQKYDDIKVIPFPIFLRTDNIIDIIKDYDLVLDGSDNFPTRYLINDACLILGKPLIFGAIYQTEGQVAIFNKEGQKSVNYRDIYPTPPAAQEVPNCNETGVLGVLPGLIGTLMATETIKLISGYGETLSGKMLFYNLIDHSTYKIELSKNPESDLQRPQSVADLHKMDYHDFCGISAQLDWDTIPELLEQNPETVLIDVREEYEEPKLEEYPYTRIELSQLDNAHESLYKFTNILIFCQSGIRSQQAAKALQEKFPDKNIKSIAGGILSLTIRN